MTPSLLRKPRSTYRVQLNHLFTFADAEKIVPYLKELGISELYASPFFKAVPGSLHGYDVSDHHEINPELGGRTGLDSLSQSLRRNSMGLLSDFVPNHMGIVGPYNWRWLDVLENGADSKFAHYFDIEWKPRLESLNRKVMVPTLGDHYGRILEAGQLQLSYEDSAFWIQTSYSRFPVRPTSCSLIFYEMRNFLSIEDKQRDEFCRLLQELEQHEHAGKIDEISSSEKVEIQELKKSLGLFLDDPRSKEALAKTIILFNGNVGDPVSFNFLHQLLEAQNYRLTYWKAGAHEVNYRRFFAVDTLIGLRMEDPAVFGASHETLSELIQNEIITGVRIDHIDGLWNPLEYLQRLESLAGTHKPIYTLVEKILAPHETLPDSWPVHGTSGYEFASEMISLFLRPETEKVWTETYRDFTGISKSGKDLTYEAKRFVLSEIFPNAITNLALELDQLIEADRHWRDLTVHDLEVALTEIIACLPLYRTYRMPGEKMSERETDFINQSLQEVLVRNRCMDPVPFNFVANVILGHYPAANEADERKHHFDSWLCKLQQATGAVMAKSVEDTVFYRYTRMFASNEVGHHPSRFGNSVDAFHRANIERLQHFPLNMLASSTHDTKMSEDVRARLFALSGMHEEWRAALKLWRETNQVYKTTIAGMTAPDSNEEYLLYQILLGSWPLGSETSDPNHVQRIKAYFRKAVEEAKINTSWTHPYEAWLEACERFVDGVISPSRPDPFLKSFLPLAHKVAANGMIFSLAQTVLKLTVPGVPDIYQGNEIWDFSLVDPDNRRAIDFPHRMELLASLAEKCPKELLRDWQTGEIKMSITQNLLRHRESQPQLYSEGAYEPVIISGERKENLVAFKRIYEGRELLVVVPISLHNLATLPIGDYWADTQLAVSGPGLWTHLFMKTEISPKSDRLSVASLFEDWPVAVLYRAT